MDPNEAHVAIHYILKNGKEIPSDEINLSIHQFPIELVNGIEKIEAIKNVKLRNIKNASINLYFHEDGRIKDDLL